MSTIFFCSHSPSKYSDEKWRCQLSQWYDDSMGFTYKKNPFNIYISKYFDSSYEDIVMKYKFRTREQWMMFHKALIFAQKDYKTQNLDIVEKIMNSNDQDVIRSLGREVNGYNEKIWADARYEIVLCGNYLQFTQNEEMKLMLLNTKDRIIVEAASYDRIWGIGFNENNADKNKDKWGLNLLGKVLMEVRNILSQI